MTTDIDSGTRKLYIHERAQNSLNIIQIKRHLMKVERLKQLICCKNNKDVDISPKVNNVKKFTSLRSILDLNFQKKIICI